MIISFQVPSPRRWAAHNVGFADVAATSSRLARDA